MAKRRSLGRGLEALLGNQTAIISEKSEPDPLKKIAVDLLQRGQYQPRKDFNKEALQELADSIREQGIVQPIVVRALPNSKKFEIIAGERRWRAAQLVNLQTVPVIIKDVPDKTVMCIALIENIQREDLNSLEEAQALQRLLEEFDMTHDAIADAVGRSRSAVTNLLRLLELHPKVKQLIGSGKIDMGHARTLLALPSTMQMDIAGKVANQGLSVRATESLVRSLLNAGGQKKKATMQKIDPNVRRLQAELSEKLAAKVELRYRKNGKGELTIHYSSLEQLDGILKRIK